MRDYIRLAGVLLIVCAIAAALLGYTNQITYDKIQDQMLKASDEARKEVLPDAQTFEKLDDNAFATISSNSKYNFIKGIFVAKNGSDIVGYAINVAPKGYGGPVNVTVGITAEGIISGIKVGDNTETAGLGANASKPNFQEQFKDKKWDNPVNVIKNGTPKDNEIVALSGATITSKAVTSGVNQALEAAKELSGK